jgi:hypothetical protein
MAVIDAHLRKMLAALGIIAIATLAQAQTDRPNPETNAIQTPAIPKGRETDIKLYRANGSAAVIGGEALEQMPTAGLTLWLAGNQFFAMDDVVAAFHKQHSAISVGLVTLPPGLLLQAIQAGGWVCEDKEYRGRPDIYASVNLGHLRELKASGIMDSYMVYMHNELQIMVAKGNPKKIAGVQDLARADVRTSMPNPLNEGIMRSTSARCWSGTASGRRFPAAKSACIARPPPTIGLPQFTIARRPTGLRQINRMQEWCGRRKCLRRWATGK